MKPKNTAEIVMGSILVSGLLGLGLGFMFLGFVGGLGAGIVSSVLGGLTSMYVKF